MSFYELASMLNSEILNNSEDDFLLLQYPSSKQEDAVFTVISFHKKLIYTKPGLTRLEIQERVRFFFQDI